MAIRGLSPAAVRDYVLKSDPCRGALGATIFKLKTLNGYELALLRDRQMALNAADKTVKVNLYGPAYEACRVGLDGWSKFLDAEGKEIPGTLERLTPDQALDLMGEIFSGGILSETEAKNSEGQSLPGNSIPNVTATVVPIRPSGDATEGL